jgi:acetyl-CoA C-acetyltransferase
MTLSILGTGITPFGELWDRSLEDLAAAAMFEAIGAAKLAAEDIEAVYVANMGAGAIEGQMHLGALVSSRLPHHPPAVRAEGACASGSLALLMAEQALLSGRYRTVLAVGAEKMTDLAGNEATKMLAGAADIEREAGATFPGLYAILAQQHQRKFGTTREQLSAVAVQNHRHALDNPNAQFHKELTAKQVSTSQLIADPIRLLDCSPVSDGAAAIVLTTRRVKGAPRVLGFGHGGDSLTLAGRESLTSLAATARAARQAFVQSGLKPKDIGAAEVHDCFTIAQLLALADLGFFKPEDAGTATLTGQTTYGGKLVVNPSGGLKGSGHPVGATGVKQVAYLARLIRDGRFERALAHNVGGSGATAVVHILGGAA